MTATDNKSDQSSSLLEEQRQDNMQQLPDDPPWLDGSEDSDEDEWFFDSIHRYKQLCTYSLICEATSIDIHMSSRRLVVAGLRPSSVSLNVSGHETRNIFEVAIYNIPEKLTVEGDQEKEGLMKGRDLSLHAGVALDQPILQVMFINEKLLFIVQKTAISAWKIIDDSDLLINEKTISLEGTALFKTTTLISEKSLLVCYSNSGGKHIGCIEINDNFLEDVNGQQRISDIDNVDLAACPKNLAIEKVENFNNDVISLIAWEGSSFDGTKFHLFFEPIPILEDRLVLPFLGGIELDKSHSCEIDLKSKSEGYIRDNHIAHGNVCWTRCNESPGKGILGASVTSKEGDEKNELTLLLYLYSDLRNQISHSSKCVQKLGLDQDIASHYTASTEYTSSITTKFVPCSNENSAVHSNCANNSSDIIHNRKLIISNGPLIYLYNIKILSLESCQKSDFSWKAACYQLFCHDAHKSNVLHVQPYSPKLPNLFFSADSDKKLHAWHWQTREKENTESKNNS